MLGAGEERHLDFGSRCRCGSGEGGDACNQCQVPDRLLFHVSLPRRRSCDNLDAVRGVGSVPWSDDLLNFARRPLFQKQHALNL
jgi:hypothetical protein